MFILTYFVIEALAEQGYCFWEYSLVIFNKTCSKNCSGIISYISTNSFSWAALASPWIGVSYLYILLLKLLIILRDICNSVQHFFRTCRKILPNLPPTILRSVTRGLKGDFHFKCSLLKIILFWVWWTKIYISGVVNLDRNWLPLYFH